jgi:hypothetical protein
MSYIAVALICAWIGHTVGWRSAHITVAKECERLGKFFVGKTVYECTAIRRIKEDSAEL